ncbi:hypothetical protein DN752_04900 [Echinicola strongylocentroti]|uniref:Heparan-alpha-glucosaminide N-acetyltransferase catalytic domain-containing protein n=2 Tax=Echinicola strongylocentroti TaxID=1795355 RepID=A0A2Z4IFQ1_9BACT|nr:hypothetical protein DN752_04900 [Echinicola strongylocentroti]
MYRQTVSNKKLSIMLAKRGGALLLLELAVNNFLYTFDPYYGTTGVFILAMLGISLLLLSVLIYLPSRVLLFLSIMAVFGHHLLDGFHVGETFLLDLLGSLIHEQQFIETKATLFIINYTILPWAPLLWIGYVIGHWFDPTYPKDKRKQKLRFLGIACLLLFIILRISGWYGEASPWLIDANSFPMTLMSFFDLTKYPASLCLLACIFGVMLLLLGSFEDSGTKVTKALTTYGQHSLLIYLFSTLILHLTALVILPIEGISMSAMIIKPESYLLGNELENHGFPLITVYAIWIFAIITLYLLFQQLTFTPRSKTNQQDRITND